MPAQGLLTARHVRRRRKPNLRRGELAHVQTAILSCFLSRSSSKDSSATSSYSSGHIPTPDFSTEPIDPDEPTYCLCQQVSFGEMIGCDNDNVSY